MITFDAVEPTTLIVTAREVLDRFDEETLRQMLDFHRQRESPDGERYWTLDTVEDLLGLLGLPATREVPTS